MEGYRILTSEGLRRRRSRKPSLGGARLDILPGKTLALAEECRGGDPGGRRILRGRRAVCRTRVRAGVCRGLRGIPRRRLLPLPVWCRAGRGERPGGGDGEWTERGRLPGNGDRRRDRRH